MYSLLRHRTASTVRTNCFIIGNRHLASSSSAAKKLFDTNAKAKQKASAYTSDNVHKYQYLRDHMATQLVDRLYDIPRTFSNGLDLFCGSGHVLKALHTRQRVDNSSRSKVDNLVHSDIHPIILSQLPPIESSSSSPATSYSPSQSFVYNEDGPSQHEIQHPPYDVVLSSGGLHWINDLPRTLTQVRQSLNPDGVFIGAMYGGSTLQELRISMQLAEDELCNRIAPRISPMVHLRDVANLLSVAGFTMTTVDSDSIVISFENLFALTTHLKGMGESNALHQREIHYGRKTFQRAAQIYEERFGQPDPDDPNTMRIPATFEIMYMIGWTPNPSQRKRSEIRPAPSS